MRHFIGEPGAVSALPPGVRLTRFERSLVTLLRLTATQASAPLRAIARAMRLPAITVRADETSDGALAAKISPKRLGSHQKSRRRALVCASLNMLDGNVFHLSQRTGS
jgi:hypothetical protein